MLDFVASAFRGLISLILVIIIIACAGVGYFVGENVFMSGFIGLILGALAGLPIIVLFGGALANFLNMVDNTKRIEEEMADNTKRLDKTLVNVEHLLSQIAKQVGNLEYQLCDRNHSSATSSNYTSVADDGSSQVASGTTSWWCKECGKKNTGPATKCAYCNR